MFALKDLYLLVLVTVFSGFQYVRSVEQHKSCPENWKQLNNKCYRVTDSATWYNESIKICNDWNAQLVSIHSEEENEFIYDLFDASKHDLDGNNWFRTGLLSVDSKSKIYFWIDGSALDFTNWNSRCPVGNEAWNVVWYSLNTNDRWKQWVNDVDLLRFSVCSFVL